MSASMEDRLSMSLSDIITKNNRGGGRGGRGRGGRGGRGGRSQAIAPRQSVKQTLIRGGRGGRGGRGAIVSRGMSPVTGRRGGFVYGGRGGHVPRGTRGMSPASRGFRSHAGRQNNHIQPTNSTTTRNIISMKTRAANRRQSRISNARGTAMNLTPVLGNRSSPVVLRNKGTLNATPFNFNDSNSHQNNKMVIVVNNDKSNTNVMQFKGKPKSPATQRYPLPKGTSIQAKLKKAKTMLTTRNQPIPRTQPSIQKKGKAKQARIVQIRKAVAQGQRVNGAKGVNIGTLNSKFATIRRQA